MPKVAELLNKSVNTLKEEGLGRLGEKAWNYSRAALRQKLSPPSPYEAFADVLFINGCDNSVPHPARYRVTHQKEQLFANNVLSHEVYYLSLRMDQLRYYRVFVFFRCPHTDRIEQFIKEAKKLNKTVLFDIDDLVVDTKYTDTIKYIGQMTPEEKAVYDDGVIRMGKTLRLCDAAITTTERLAAELRHYVPEVIINRNTASEEMLQLSEQAAYERDVLPYLDVDKLPKNVKPRRYQRARAQAAQRAGRGVSMGYFSGSLTHNDDFLLILPAIVRIMRENPTVELHVVGQLDLPEELKQFADRVIALPFSNWKKLPQMVASVDINLAPLEQSIFNEAKSENKWVEAALVKVPTVASNVGAFARMIEHEVTGVLCSGEQDWYRELTRMIQDTAWRKKIAQNAYRFCREHCVTLYTGHPLTEYILRKRTPNIAFVLPSVEISGGILVALKHCVFLQDAGWDVLLLNETPDTEWLTFEGHTFPVLSRHHHLFVGRLDACVATMWTTVAFLETNNRIGRRYYLVQNFETDFYSPNFPLRIPANQSYSPQADVAFLTISRWCQQWLKDRFGQDAQYAPNGLYTRRFYPEPREFSGRIRILIEGDCGVDYKNVDESFAVVDKLDPEHFEVWYMSYQAEPKSFYRVDRFLHKLPYEQVPDIYRQCHILLKSSILESFSYPPLEMMATGGYVVVAPNGGNREYLVDGQNCLLYQLGDIEGAAHAIERICTDSALRAQLYAGGQRTAQSRDWEGIREDILALYQPGQA